jgi:DNA-binding transcriptional LysR family regulator
LAGRNVITAEEVGDSAMIVRRQCEVLNQTSRYFTSRGVRPFICARTTSDEQAIELVRGGHGLTVVPDCYSAHGIALARLAGFNEARRIGIVQSRGSSCPVEATTVFSIISTEIWREREALPESFKVRQVVCKAGGREP